MPHRFWNKHPALLYAVLANGAAAAAFTGKIWIFFPLIILLFPFKKALFTRFAFAALLSLSVFAFIKAFYLLPEVPAEGLKGTAHFIPEKITKNTHSFQKEWRYSGTVRLFTSQGEAAAKNLPCSIYYKEKRGCPRPSADQGYFIEGTLKKSGGGYVLFPEKETNWRHAKGPILKTAEFRFFLKEAVSKAIASRYPHPKSAAFLSGIATGEFEDQILREELSRFGLQHIMAISGFHFTLAASICYFFLQIFFPRKTTAALLIFFMSSYFILLGPSASILRAWLSSIILFSGVFAERRPNGLNSLGAAALFVTIFDPLMAQTPGFYFSCATTAAILIFTPLFDDLLARSFQKRRLGISVMMPSLSQHGYIILMIVRKALALSLAVNLAAAPLMLFYFQKFPLMGLAYNLFFPFLVSASLFLLLIGTFVPCIDLLNSYFTNFFLNIAYNMPKSLEGNIKGAFFSEAGILIYLSFIFFGGILWKEKYERKMQFC